MRLPQREWMIAKIAPRPSDWNHGSRVTHLSCRGHCCVHVLSFSVNRFPWRYNPPGLACELVHIPSRCDYFMRLLHDLWRRVCCAAGVHISPSRDTYPLQLDVFLFTHFITSAIIVYYACVHTPDSYVARWVAPQQPPAVELLMCRVLFTRWCREHSVLQGANHSLPRYKFSRNTITAYLSLSLSRNSSVSFSLRLFFFISSYF